MNLKAQRETAAKAARAIAEGAKAAERDLTADEVTKINGLVEEVKGLDIQIKAAEDASALLDTIGTGPEVKQTPAQTTAAKSLGEHAVKGFGEQLAKVKGSSERFSFGTSEYKAATDSHARADGGALHAQIDETVVQGFRERPTVASWLGSGTLTAASITYYVEALKEGAFSAVAEGGLKPQLHYTYDQVNDALTKIAGRVKINDEMAEDLPFLVSEINGRLLYDLVMFEEAQLLNGNGTAPQLRGLLNRSGVQVEASAAAADNADAVFRGITKVQTATGLTVDGMVINPLDYQKFRLSKDANGQYFGGGIFTGQYGNGGIPQQPGLWGQNTIVTSAIAAGTVLVGAGKQAATVYRKGGVRVEATNSNEDDFNYNRISIRAEERIALAVRKPSAFVKVTLSNL
ncbi:phage major capsid protein [Paenarthrobacter nitroguajacolicus]|uniref:phage major capsid protein n=1 Tax=Paenarthrobacter nitroguajacolicus TaxID=211146 RepID=UPI0015B96AD2|nr:phage major capsid protein [Paenarthrobacter nitroguajacolicus]NWL34436.1 phage major capsid protein [Paenarthrobacter nitroguajacolicus]